MNYIKSAFLKLNLRDIRRGLGLALSASVTFLLTAMTAGTIPDVMLWQSTGSVFVGTIGSYLVKNLLTNSQDQFLKKEGE